MSSPRHVFGVPVHPLLVHFPIVLWLSVPVLDVAALYAGPDPWWALAVGVTFGGILCGALAIATGLLEYLAPSVAGVDMRLAARHGVRTTLAWCTFTAKAAIVMALPPAGTWEIALCLVLDVIGSALLLQGVYFGTKQVYDQLEER